MDQTEYIHIISAGENILTTYPAAFHVLPTITWMYILAEDSVRFVHGGNFHLR